MLPHSATPIPTSLTFSNTINTPQKLTLHPAHNSATDFILYIGNMNGGNILEYNSTSATDSVLLTVSAVSGYQPHGVTLFSNGSIIIAAQDGLKASCCVDSFDYTTQLAGYMSATCQLPTTPVQYLHWDPVDMTTENPTDVAIDYQTQDVFVPYRAGQRVDVLLGGFLPKTTIYTTGGASRLDGITLIYRTCTRTGVLIYGVFFALLDTGNIKYLPLPLPANPSTGNVGPTVVTVASGLAVPSWFTQTYSSIEIYVAEANGGTGGKVSHWSVHSPPIGTDGTSAAVVVLTKIRDIGSVGGPVGTAVTSDDNVLLVSAPTQHTIYKATPMLPHSATPDVTSLTFSNTLNNPRKLTLHPAHNSASDFILYVGNLLGGNIVEYNSTSATDSILVTVNATTGYQPHGVTIQNNGTLIIAAMDGLKTSCCVDSFDYSTQLAGYMSATCQLPAPVQYLHWDPVDMTTENPSDAAIDHQTQDVFVPYAQGKRLDVLLGGFLPKITIYTNGASMLGGALLIHRICTRTGVLIHGVFFTENNAGSIMYFSLPLPADPSTANVGPTVVTAASGLTWPYWPSQTYSSIDLYVPEYSGSMVSHWAVSSPPIGTDGTSAAVVALTRIRDISSFGGAEGTAITSDDNVLLVAAYTENLVRKATPMLPHSATPAVTTLTFTNTINGPQKLTLHPAHNSATDFVLYVVNVNAGNILEYNSTSATDSILVTVSAANGYQPRAITLHSNGSLIIAAQDGLKMSCCVDSFDYSTQLAGYMSATCQLPAPVQYLHWDPVSVATENPTDVAIDHQTQDVFVVLYAKKSIDVLLGGFLPKTTIFQSATALMGVLLVHRMCTRTGVLIYGLFFTEWTAGNVKYLPLPLPANPSTGNVGPTVVTAASGLSQPSWFSQTHNSIELYIGEYSGPFVGHWSVHSPPIGTDGTAAAVVSLTKIRDIASVGNPLGAAITSDDNVLLVAASAQHTIYKVTPMLPHSGTPIPTSLTFGNTLGEPRKIIIHPGHNTASDFIFYVGNFQGGNILAYNSTSATDSILLTVSATLGYRPHGVTIQSNGSLIIVVENGLKTSCCVDSYDYSTQLAGYRNAPCRVPTTPVQYLHWDPVDYLTENPSDVAIDYQTQDVFATFGGGTHVAVLPGGFLPKTTLYSSGSQMIGVGIIRRTCTHTGVLLYGLFYALYEAGMVKYIPLPLPANPSTANVGPTIVTVLSGLTTPYWFSQTHNVIELYVAEKNPGRVSHWAVHSPPAGTDGASAVPTLTSIRDIGSVGNPKGVAITSDDNVLLVSGFAQNAIYKATPMLPHSATPAVTSLTFSNTVNGPQKITLHPAHNGPNDFVLYVGNSVAGNILEYNSTSATDSILLTISTTSGYLPHGVTIQSNGTLIIAASDGLKTSCCVDSFDYSTQLAGHKSASCLPTALVQYLHWDPVGSTENPDDAAIDYQTQDVFVTYYGAKRVDVLLGGFLPKITIFNAGVIMYGAVLMHRTCTRTGVLIYGLFLTEGDAGNVKYLPLPLPANPSTGNVQPTVVTAASGLAWPCWSSQTHNSIELYIPEYYGPYVSHWSVHSPPIGTDGTAAAVVALTKIRDVGTGNVGNSTGAAVTSDDNVLLVAAYTQALIKKATPMLPHSGTPTVTTLTFSNTLDIPQKITLHPAHNSASDFILYVASNTDILEYNSTSATDQILLTVPASGHAVTIHNNGTLIIAAADGLKTSCCVDSYDYTTQLAGYRNAPCRVPTTPVQYLHWDPVSYLTENPGDIAIDHQTQDVFVTYHQGKRLDVLLGGFLPKTTIYTTGGASKLDGITLIYRTCTRTGVLIYGVFFALIDTGNIKYLPLPLPANPSTGNVGPTIVTAAAPTATTARYLTQAHSSIELYIAHNNAVAKISHWAVHSAPIGTGGTSAATVSLTQIRDFSAIVGVDPIGVAITSDDNVLFLSAQSQNSVHKVTPLLPHSATPAITQLTFSNNVEWPQQLTLHPAHNSAANFILYVANGAPGNILEYNSTSATDLILLTLDEAPGYNPHAVALQNNGSLIIAAEDGLKTSCCVDSFDYSTQLAAYQSASCLPSAPVDFPNWGSISAFVENPWDAAIDFTTQDVFVTFWFTKSIDVLLGGFFPRTTIYTHATSQLMGVLLIHRICTRTGVNIYGLLFAEYEGDIKYLPLPLPANPSTGNVPATIVTAASGLLHPYYFSQTHSSVELYVAEYNGPFVSHWAVQSPQVGTSAAVLTKIREIGSVGTAVGTAITSDDNVLLVSGSVENTIYKVTPMLPHSATPGVTSLTFTKTLSSPQKVTLHPAHNSATDFILYIGGYSSGDIHMYNSTSATDSILFTVSTTINFHPRGVTLYSNGTLIIVAQDGLKISCCVDSYDYTTQLAGYQAATCQMTVPLQYPNWDSVDYTTQDPVDAAIDYQTQDLFVSYFQGNQLVVLLGGFFPKLSIYAPGVHVEGLSLVRRICTTSGALIYGLFFVTRGVTPLVKYLPLPLPANPSTSNVPATIVTAASGHGEPHYLTQTHNSIELYVGDQVAQKATHWAVHSPPPGTDGTVAAVVVLTKIREVVGSGDSISVAITSDDNVLFVVGYVQTTIYKLTPLLPHSATPTETALTFTNTISQPFKMTIHPAHNSATDFVLYIGNYGAGNILAYNSTSATDTVLVTVSASAGYRPKAVTLQSNGSLIIAAEDGLKTSCCVDSFDYSTQLAGYQAQMCQLPPPVDFPNWASVSYLTENPRDVAIDHQTQDVFVTYYNALRVDVLLGGFLPKITIYTHASRPLWGALLIHRICTHTGILIYGLFLTEVSSADNIKYIPLPLPANPSTGNVQPTVVTAASGLANGPRYLSQTHNSIEVYIAEYSGPYVSHWAVQSPPNGTDGTAAAVIALTKIRDIGSVGGSHGTAVTSDDNVLLVSGYDEGTIFKATPLLPHSATQAVTSLTFSNALSSPLKITLHPAHNSAAGFILYVGNTASGNILEYNSSSTTDSILLNVSTTTGYLPLGVTLYTNGTLIIVTMDALKISCCVDSFDYSTQLAGYQVASCQLPAPVEFPNWDPVSYFAENPMDAAIDRRTQDVYVPFAAGYRLDVLLGGLLPKTTIYTHATDYLTGALLIDRPCTTTGVVVYGLFFTKSNGGNIKYLPLPLPANPSTANVGPTVVMVASGLSFPRWMCQTHSSIEIYVAEFTGPFVGHWAVHNPDGASTAIPALTSIRNVGSVGSPNGVAITSDDNVLLVSGQTQNTIYKATPMLPHSGTPAVTSLSFSNTLNMPHQITLHPAHNSATDFVLYVGNLGGGNILEYNSTGATDLILITVSAANGYRPHALALYSNGSMIIAAEDGLKTSCCVDSFDYSTQLTCQLPPPVDFPNWDPADYLTENPHDVAIDYQTHNTFVSYAAAKRVDVLLGGFLPKTTIYTHGTSQLVGASLIHRTSTRTGVLIYGLFFTETTAGNVKYLPLPLPANPSTGNVGPTVVTAASGLSSPSWLSQTHNSTELYVAELAAPFVGHWSVHSPPIGTDGTAAAVVSLTKIRDIGSVGSPAGTAVTSDDNVLLVSGFTEHAIYKATPVLPHSATPAVTTLTFSNTVNSPNKLTLHPAHNSASDFILYVGNLNGGNIIQYNSTSATDKILLTVSAATGYRPHGITLHSNGSIIIVAEDGLKTSCCVDSYDYSTQLAGYMNATCQLPAPVEFPNWDPVDMATENPIDAAIDHQTQDLFVTHYAAMRVDVLLDGFLPKITIFSGAGNLYGAVLLHRTCTRTGVLIYGLLFAEDSGNIKYLPLPLPANPSTANVGPTVVTAASGLSTACFLSQTHNSIELYVAEYSAGVVSHWSVNTPPIGTDGTSAAVPTVTKIRDIGSGSVGSPIGAAVTSDDNVLLVSGAAQNTVYKATPMLPPHSATPAVTSLTFTNTINSPHKLTLHPAHNSATAFVLYVVSAGSGNILEYNSATASDLILLTVSATTGYQPHGVTIQSNGSIIIAAQDGLKTSCCVDSYDYSTQLAGYMSASCQLPAPVEFRNWDPVSAEVENPSDVAIDYQTQDVFVTCDQGKRLDVLLGGFFPKITIYTNGASGLLGASLMHRVCASTGSTIYGMLFTSASGANIMYLPLPLPANPSTGNVGPTVSTLASGLASPYWLSQTHNSIEIYVAEYTAPYVSHWTVSSPSPGVVTLTHIRNIGSVGSPEGAAVTSDDNVLFVSGTNQNTIYKATPMLPHSATPIPTSLTFSNTINTPQKLTLHPAHNSATDFILYVGNLNGGNILAYNSTSATDSVLLTVNATGGQRPHGITLHSHGSLIIAAQSGLKASCCVDSFDYSTQLAGYMVNDTCTTPVPTPTPNATDVPTPTPNATDTPTPTPNATAAPTPTPNATDAPTPTPNATDAPTPTPNATDAPTPTPNATDAPTPTPNMTDAPTPTPNATDAPTPTPNATDAPTPTPNMTDAPTPTPNATDAPTPTPNATDAPTLTPNATDAPTPAPNATANATDTPTPNATTSNTTGMPTPPPTPNATENTTETPTPSPASTPVPTATTRAPSTPIPANNVTGPPCAASSSLPSPKHVRITENDIRGGGNWSAFEAETNKSATNAPPPLTLVFDLRPFVQATRDWSFKSDGFAFDSVKPSPFTLAFVRPSSGMPNAKGFTGSTLMQALLQSTSVSLSSDFILTLTFAPEGADLVALRSYAIVVDESLQLALVEPSLFAATSTCEPALPMALGYVDISAQPDAALQAAAKTTDIVATAAVATGAAVGSSAAALDAQSLVIMSFMSCASSTQRVLLRHPRVLSPAALDDTLEGMIYGNLILFFGVFALQGLIVLVVRQVCDVSYDEAMGKCRFPSFTILIMTLTFQGQGAIGINLIAESGGDSTKIAVGIIGVLCCVVVIPAKHIIAHFLVSAGFASYNLEHAPDGKLPPKIVQLLLPRGRWQPEAARKAYGTIMNNIGREEKIWVSAHLWGPLTMVVGTAFRPSTTSGCVVQYSVLCVIQFLIAVLILVKRPYRSLISNFLAASMNVCFGMFLAGTAAVTSRETDTGRRTTTVGIQMIIGVTALRILHALSVFVLERLGSVTKLPKDEEFFWISRRAGRGRTRVDMTGLSADDVNYDPFEALLGDSRNTMELEENLQGGETGAPHPRGANADGATRNDDDDTDSDWGESDDDAGNRQNAYTARGSSGLLNIGTLGAATAAPPPLPLFAGENGGYMPRRLSSDEWSDPFDAIPPPPLPRHEDGGPITADFSDSDDDLL